MRTIPTSIEANFRHMLDVRDLSYDQTLRGNSLQHWFSASCYLILAKQQVYMNYSFCNRSYAGSGSFSTHGHQEMLDAMEATVMRQMTQMRTAMEQSIKESMETSMKAAMEASMKEAMDVAMLNAVCLLSQKGPASDQPPVRDTSDEDDH